LSSGLDSPLSPFSFQGFGCPQALDFFQALLSKILTFRLHLAR
jgi:hypothetical protein